MRAQLETERVAGHQKDSRSAQNKSAESATLGDRQTAAWKTVEATREFAKPTWGKSARIRVTAKAYQIGSNQHPYFSVTAAIGTPRELETGNWQAGGCLHEDAAKAWPKIKPLIALHLSNADDGEPMHAEANGYYWLAGAFGGFGEAYHGGNSTTPKSTAECLQIFADYVRIDLNAANFLGEEIAKIAAKDRVKARGVFDQWIDLQRVRWQKEAREGMELLKILSV